MSIRKVIRRWLGIGELWERQQQTSDLVSDMCAMLRNHDETMNPFFMNCLTQLAVALVPVIGADAVKALYHSDLTPQELHESMLETQRSIHEAEASPETETTL